MGLVLSEWYLVVLDTDGKIKPIVDSEGKPKLFGSAKEAKYHAHCYLPDSVKWRAITFQDY